MPYHHSHLSYEQKNIYNNIFVFVVFDYLRRLRRVDGLTMNATMINLSEQYMSITNGYSIVAVIMLIAIIVSIGWFIYMGIHN